MRKVLAVFAAAVVLSLIAHAQTGGPPATPERGKDGRLEADANRLKSTILAPHLEEPLVDGKNVIWSAAFQQAWNDACDLLGGEIHLAAEAPAVAILNRKDGVRKDLDDATCLAMAGWLNEGVEGRFAKALAEKFKGRGDASLATGAAPGDTGLALYACIEKQVEFAVRFDPPDYRYEFGGVSVKGFGFDAQSPRRAELVKQVVLYTDRSDPIVELKTTSPGDRLIFAQVDRGDTLAQTVASVLERLKEAQPVDSEKEGIERLVMPMVDFARVKDFHELEGLLKVAMGAGEARPLRIARERVALAFPAPADRPASDEAMRRWEVWGDTVVFDEPFLLMLLRKGAERPYFAMWVEDPEVLLRAPTNFPYAEMGPVSEGLIRVSSVRTRGYFFFQHPVGNCGFIDMKGNVVIPLRFADVGAFDHGIARAAVVRPDAPKEDLAAGLEREPGTIIWGLIDRQGKWVVKPQFGDLRGFHEDLAAAMEAPPPRIQETAEGPRKWGFINRNGLWVIKPQFDYAGDFAAGAAAVQTADQKEAYIDKTGKFVARPEPDRTGGFEDGLELVEKEGKQWYIDTKGRFVFALPAGYELYDTSIHDAAVIKAEDRFAVIDRTGKVLVEVEHGDWNESDEATGVITLTASGPVGFIDADGKKVIDAKFGDAQCFSEGLAAVCVKGKWGYIDRTGRIVVQPQFSEAKGFHEGLAAVKLDDKWGFVDKTGKLAIQPRFTSADDFHDGKARVGIDYEEHYIDKASNLVEPPRVEPTRPLCDGRRAFETDRGLWGFTDEHSRPVIEPRYREVGDFAEKAAPVTDRDKWGFIDTEGQVLVKAQYEAARSFREGLAAACVDGKWGFLDHAFHWAVRPQFDEATDFADGRAAVRVGVRRFHVDKSGKRITPEEWDSFDGFVEGLAVAGPPASGVVVLPDAKVVRVPGFEELEDVYEDSVVLRTVEGVGFMDMKGEWIVRPRFANGYPFVEGLAGVMVGEKWGYIDRTGRMVIPPRFDYVGCFIDGVARVGIGETHISESESRWGLIDRTGKSLTHVGGK